MRLNYPLLISEGRGYRIRCSTQGEEEAVILGLGFLALPTTTLEASSETVVAAAPLENPLLCPTSPAFPIKAFRFADADGEKLYLQFPQALNSTLLTNRIYVPGCRALVEALGIDVATALAADPRPFFGDAVHAITCNAGEPVFDSQPATFTAWCGKSDLSPAEIRTVEALLAATPEDVAGRGQPAACQRAQDFLAGLSSLNLSGLGLTNAAPLVPLVDLTALDLSENGLVDISPLARLTKLSFLDLSGNDVQNLSALSALTALSELRLAGNGIANLRPLSALVALRKLDLSQNGISDLRPLARLVAVTELILAGNAIDGASLEPLAGLSALTFLDVSNNRIESLEGIAALPSNVSIRLDGNPVLAGGMEDFADVCTAHRGDATPFGFTVRVLFETAGKATCREAADALTSIVSLPLSGKNLSDIRPLALFKNLRNLDLSANAISDVSALRGLVELRQLNLAANSIRDISPLAELTALDALDLSANPVDVSSYLPACMMRTHADVLTAHQLAEVNALFSAVGRPNCLASDADLKRRTHLRVAGVGLRSVGYFGVLSRIESLELPDNAIADVSALSEVPNLARLDLSGNQIASLSSFAGLQRLSRLSLARNPLGSLNALHTLPELTELDLSGTAVRVIRQINALPRLTQARLRDLDIDYLSFEDYCLVEKFDPMALGAARAFVLAANAVAAGQGVEVLDCQEMGDWAAGLALLNLNKRELTNIDPIRHFGALTELHLYDNRIQDMGPLAELRSLRNLSLASNQVTILPRLQSQELKSLNLSHNRIGQVDVLGELSSLETLDLEDNRIVDASALRSLGQLSRLDLRGNRIVSIRGLAHWTEPATYISGNPICDFPHESSEVMAACKRKPGIGVVWDLDDVLVRPIEIVEVPVVAGPQPGPVSPFPIDGIIDAGPVIVRPQQ
ncbi:MAG TPA: leucine-rich repeat domain-containing protein [Mesorhizobium sp.]|nr:leucine-rich repeat domain-containing protein [Mesorhizobium sp.]